MSHQRHLKNPKYRYWVKAGLGLKYVKEGLVGFVDDILKQQQTNILTALTSSIPKCSQCNLQSLLPSHAHGNKSKNKQCPLRLTQCNCMYSSKRLRKCPNNICDTIHDSIVQQHASNPPAPNWKNSDITAWGQNHWEIGKCYIYAAGYAKKTTGREIDCSGLLHIIINNKEAHKHVSCNITGNGQDTFSMIRAARNEILHSGTMELEKSQADDYIDDMVALLSDQKELAQRPDSVYALKLLKMLKSENFVISTKDETETIQEAISAIEAKKLEALEEIEKKCEKTKTELDDMAEGLHDDLKDTNRAIDDIHKRISILENQLKELSKKHAEDVDSLKQQLFGVKVDIDRLAETRTKHDKRLEFLQRRKDLQSYLVKLYSEHYVKVSASPLMPSENDTDIGDIYVTPIMKRCGGQPDGTAQNQSIYIQSYRDIFEKDGKRVKNVYISGDAGIGKSVFCKNMIRKWCVAHSDETKQAGYDDGIKIMEDFDFLLFVSLRHAGGRNHLHDMIIHQLTDGQGSVVAEILENEDEKCLVLLDGLDEWTPPADLSDLKPFENPDLPRRDHMKSYTVVTTTRHQKLATVDIKISDIDNHFHILGLSNRSLREMTGNVVSLLNKKFERSRKAEDFVSQLLRTHFWKTNIPKIPIMFQQILCIWYDKNTILESSLSEIFTCMLDLMFRWAEIREQRDRKLKSFRLETMEQLKKKAVEDGADAFALPSILQSYAKCNEYQTMIYFLGKFAFNTLYAKNQAQLVFDRECLSDGVFSDDAIELALNVGLFTEDRIKGVAAAVSPHNTITFLHKTFQEFFAAYFIAVRALNTAYLRRDYILFGAVKCKQSSETLSLLSQLVSRTNDLKAFLENSNVIMLLCGLYPPLCALIYEKIYNHAASDLETALDNFQKFVFVCIKECISNNSNFPKECIKIMAINIDNKLQASLMQYVDSASVHIARINWAALLNFQLDGYMENIAKSGNLRGLEIDASCCQPHETRSTSLHKILKESSDSLVVLTLRGIRLYVCAQAEHLLPDMTILRELILDNVSLSPKQTKSLSAFFTKSRHLLNVRFSHVALCDTAARSWVSIEGFYSNAPDPITIDLSNHKELEYVSIDQSRIILTKLNKRKLKTYSLGILEPEILIENIQCAGEAKELRHLSIHNHLSYYLVHCLQSDHSFPVCDALQATIETIPNLETLSISGYMDSELSFKSLANLKTVTFFNVQLKCNDIWFKSVESLLRLQQSVSVEVRLLTDKEELLKFVESNASYRVTEVDNAFFIFKSLK